MLRHAISGEHPSTGGQTIGDRLHDTCHQFLAVLHTYGLELPSGPVTLAWPLQARLAVARFFFACPDKAPGSGQEDARSRQLGEGR